MDVQVESGPKEGTLLVTWLPVTITTLGTSNGTKVIGYVLFIDGQVIKELPNPTGHFTVIHILYHKSFCNSYSLFRLFDVISHLFYSCYVFVGDHVVLLSEDLKFVSSPEEVTVRTAGEDSRSMPSIPAKISQHLVMEINNYRMKAVREEWWHV